MAKYDSSSGNVPNEVYQALEDFIEDLQMECADNFRFTPVGDVEGEAWYAELEAYGCCGGFERIVKDVTGKDWRIGCNYGH